MRVLVLTPEVRRASYRLRVAEVFPRVKGLEFETAELARSGTELDRAIDRAGEFDAVVLQKRLLERREAWRLRSRAKRIIYEVDDAVMNATPEGESWWSARKRRARFGATAEILDLAVAGNGYLAALLGEQRVRTEVIPTCVEPSEYAVREHAEPARVRAVWIGSASTRPYLEAILPAIAKAARGLEDRMVLSVIADRPVNPHAGLDVEFTPWSLPTEKRLLAQADIGIAPTPDDAWSRGKCGFKILQYMAAGLPVVASPVGANAEIVIPAETGLLPSGEAEWVEFLIRLGRGSPIRATMGMSGRRRVESLYPLGQAAKKWHSILSESWQV